MLRRDILPRAPHARGAGRDVERLRKRADGAEDLDRTVKREHRKGGGVIYHERDFAPNTNVMQGQGLITFVKVPPNDDEDDLATFGGRLRSARKALGLSQGELAQLVGVVQGSIANWENGIRDAPREILRLARSVQVRATWLRENRGPRKDEHSDHGETGNLTPVNAENLTDFPDFDRTTATGSDAELLSMEKYLAETLRTLKPDERLALIDYARFLRGEPKFKSGENSENVKTIRKRGHGRGGTGARAS